MAAEPKKSAPKGQEKILVKFVHSCGAYAKGEIAALPVDMANAALARMSPQVCEVHGDGIPKPRDKSKDGASSIAQYRERALRAEGALGVALDKLEANDTKTKKTA